MSCLSAVEAQLPPGFRFHPRDEELICDYLMKWITGSPQHSPFLIEVDLNKCEPWDIPEAACVGGKEWYFYSQRDRKYATGLRTNRATVSGYWKATGKDRPAIKNGNLVGMRKTLVFYQGRAPKGRKTEWIMHEFRLEGNMELEMKTFAKEDWVLCRVFYKNRSEAITCKQEKPCILNQTSSPSSLPPLTEPQITFNNPTHAPRMDDQYQEQVPCFSIYPQNQTAPNNNSIFPHILPSTRIMPTNFDETLPEHEVYNSQLSYNNNCDDQKVLKALLSHITKIGSSDNYPSDVGGLSSIWNHYS